MDAYADILYIDNCFLLYFLKTLLHIQNMIIYVNNSYEKATEISKYPQNYWKNHVLPKLQTSWNKGNKYHLRKPLICSITWYTKYPYPWKEETCQMNETHPTKRVHPQNHEWKKLIQKRRKLDDEPKSSNYSLKKWLKKPWASQVSPMFLLQIFNGTLLPDLDDTCATVEGGDHLADFWWGWLSWDKPQKTVFLGDP